MTSVQASRWDLDAAKYWWILLVTGLFWIAVSVVVLRFDEKSVSAVGVIVGVFFLLAGFSEFAMASLSRGWRWLNITMGVLLLLGAIWAFTEPKETFWALASVVGFLFVLKGTMDIIVAMATKGINDLWWVGLTAGILEVLLGFWASQQLAPGRAALIIFWVGLGALFRGINQIVFAFHLKGGGE